MPRTPSPICNLAPAATCLLQARSHAPTPSCLPILRLGHMLCPAPCFCPVSLPWSRLPDAACHTILRYCTGSTRAPGCPLAAHPLHARPTPAHLWAPLRCWACGRSRCRRTPRPWACRCGVGCTGPRLAHMSRGLHLMLDTAATRSPAAGAPPSHHSSSDCKHTGKPPTSPALPPRQKEHAARGAAAQEPRTLDYLRKRGHLTSCTTGTRRPPGAARGRQAARRWPAPRGAGKRQGWRVGSSAGSGGGCRKATQQSTSHTATCRRAGRSGATPATPGPRRAASLLGTAGPAA